MIDTKQIPCSCTACSELGCLCGCQQPAVQSPCACGPQSKCGPNCTCAKS
jgi:hypothetical protein